MRTRYQAHHEAEALRPAAERRVAILLREQNDSAGVVDALRADGLLSEPLRQAARRAVLRMRSLRKPLRATRPGAPATDDDRWRRTSRTRHSSRSFRPSA